MRAQFGAIRFLEDQRGATAIMVALMMVVFIGFAALAVDVGHLYVVRNELQNAADAGALAGARFLYNQEGTAINEGANQIAYEASMANKSEKVPVDVHWVSGNEGDVERGHWSFATRTFTPNPSTLPVDLWDVSFEQLDANPNFINAVRVKTRRQDTPAASFFARIFGHEFFTLSSQAVAYIGFAGTLAPFDVDQPIAICKDSLLNGGKYSCNIGRMINSGQNVESNETGGWTSFYQGEDACQGGTNAQEVRSLVCGEGNPDPLTLGNSMATNGGDIATAFKKLRECWETATSKSIAWTLTLPVVECTGNNITTCQPLVGAVTVNIVWITGEGTDASYSEAPWRMDDWSSTNTDGLQRWTSFVNHFNLKNVDGSPAPYQKKAIYFKPDCEPHLPTGRTGGVNFGILAKIPVLVN